MYATPAEADIHLRMQRSEADKRRAQRETHKGIQRHHSEERASSSDGVSRRPKGEKSRAKSRARSTVRAKSHGRQSSAEVGRDEAYGNQAFDLAQLRQPDNSGSSQQHCQWPQRQRECPVWRDCV